MWSQRIDHDWAANIFTFMRMEDIPCSSSSFFWLSFSPLLFAVGQKTDKGQMKLFHFTYSCVLSHVHLFATLLIGTRWPYGLEPPRLLCPWDFPGKNTGVACHFLHQGIFPARGLSPSPCVSCTAGTVLTTRALREATFVSVAYLWFCRCLTIKDTVRSII